MTYRRLVYRIKSSPLTSMLARSSKGETVRSMRLPQSFWGSHGSIACFCCFITKYGSYETCRRKFRRVPLCALSKTGKLLINAWKLLKNRFHSRQLGNMQKTLADWRKTGRNLVLDYRYLQENTMTRLYSRWAYLHNQHETRYNCFICIHSQRLWFTGYGAESEARQNFVN
jgi:hypothetical protein